MSALWIKGVFLDRFNPIECALRIVKQEEYDMEWLSMELWSPYVVGAGIGILSWLTFLVSDKPIGCSTAFARTSGMIERLFRGLRQEFSTKVILANLQSRRFSR